MQTVEGPTGTQFVSAVADTAIDSSTRLSYAAFLRCSPTGSPGSRAGAAASRPLIAPNWPSAKAGGATILVSIRPHYFGQLGEPQTTQLNAILGALFIARARH